MERIFECARCKVEVHQFGPRTHDIHCSECKFLMTLPEDQRADMQKFLDERHNKIAGDVSNEVVNNG